MPLDASPAGTALDLHHLVDRDLGALCGLKLTVEVGASVDVAFEIARSATRDWHIDFLIGGRRRIAADPIDATTLSRARAWLYDLERSRRPRARPRTSVAKAVEAFVALERAEVSRAREPEWIDISEVSEVSVPRAPAHRRRPSRPDSVVVRPIEAPPGFAGASKDPWSLPMEVTKTQLNAA